MLKISITDNLDQVVRNLEAKAKRHVKFATARALTNTAKLVRRDLQQEMGKVFDRPTPYTLKSLYIKSATKDNLEAKVWLKDDTFKGTPAEKYLGPQIFGGPRKLKRFERQLAAARLMPSGMFAVPGSAAKLDAHGNMARGQLIQILAFVRAFGEQGYRANMTAKRRASFTRRTQYEYFVGRPGKRAPLGIWERRRFSGGSAVRPVIIYVKAPSYRQRLDFFGVAQQTIQKEFIGEFNKAIAEASSGD